MSAQWMGFYFDNRDTRLEGSLLLTLLAIADHADSTGAAMGPSRDLIAEKARVTIGQVRRNLRVLEEYGYLQMQRGQGRGKRSFYQLLRPELPRQGLTQKEDTDVIFSEPENDREIKGCMGDTFSENEKGCTDDTFSDDKRVHGRTKKGAPVHTPPPPPHKDNPFKPFRKQSCCCSASASCFCGKFRTASEPREEDRRLSLSRLPRAARQSSSPSRRRTSGRCSQDVDVGRGTARSDQVLQHDANGSVADSRRHVEDRRRLLAGLAIQKRRHEPERRIRTMENQKEDTKCGRLAAWVGTEYEYVKAVKR